MGTIVIKNQPCISDDCGSSDARQIYDDGTSFCFSCNNWFPAEGNEMVTPEAPKKTEQKLTIEEVKTYAIRGFRERLIKDTVTKGNTQMQNMFTTITAISSGSWKFAKFLLSAMVIVAFWGVVTATGIFGFYFISSGVMVVFTALAVVTGVAVLVALIGFIWKMKRLFFPKVEPIEPATQA